ncbi:hypothetical protein ARMA_0816 [Ardenticatena maritima]|uniref:Peroxidase n=1 Tax=Ardenticatena maritima TaxID=872965 RepID=A0A0M8K5V7_9CHLR|nr:hypothetical protein ARMA_0816 [Ardenticatena maritima]
MKDETLVRQLADDYTQAPLSPAERAMLDYAVKLTRTPWAVDETDIAALRNVGWDDRAILDIAQITAYFNYVNRLAEGLGIVLEDYWQEDDILE